MSLQEVWCGVRGAELDAVAGIPGCVFVHANVGVVWISTGSASSTTSQSAASVNATSKECWHKVPEPAPPGQQSSTGEQGRALDTVENTELSDQDTLEAEHSVLRLGRCPDLGDCVCVCPECQGVLIREFPCIPVCFLHVP